MSLRKIVEVPHPSLRNKAERVTEFDQDLKALLDDMVETMRAEDGVGLAGPQIDVGKRVLVVEFGSETDPELPPTVYQLVNPEITRSSPETVLGAEGCLSIPGFMGDVERSLHITIEGQNHRGDPLKMQPRGWLARVFQHEVDHLNGILFTDRAEQVWEIEDEAEDYHAV
ncbi:MAG: peptide deformylase [Anaerolineales bacterium]|nr:peptide deformylase [Anaerolineales bacterium]